LKALIDFKKNEQKINQLSEENIKAKAKEVVIAAQNSEPDKANDIGEFQEKEEFHKGISTPDKDKLYERTIEFLGFSKLNFPNLIMEQIITKFIHEKNYFLNSNGTDLQETNGYYSIVAMFTSKDGKKTSSFNYAAVDTDNLDKPFAELGRFTQLMKESTEQTEMKHIPENFVGDVIITPECFEDFLHYFSSMISTVPLITNTCIFKDKINSKIASEQFTLNSKPINDDFTDGYFYDADGYKVENFPYVKNGVLQSFILGLYGSNKTGLPRSANSGYYWEVEAGNAKYDDMIKSVKKGILMCRFSGGNPAQNGDFSGVAKNSYYIENGCRKYCGIASEYH
jgi:PmbA protein